MNQKIGMFFVLLLFSFSLLFSIGKAKEKKGIKIEVDKDGNISWITTSVLAKSGIRWQTQGFHILLEESNLGFPFGKENNEKKTHLKILVDGESVLVEEVSRNRPKFPDFRETVDVKYTIKGSKVRQEILKNDEFYRKMIEKIKKNRDTKIYLNGFFETFQIVENESIRNLVKTAYRNKSLKQYKESFKGSYFTYGGFLYQYDNIIDMVKQIRKKDLINLNQIMAAEGWSFNTQKEWSQKENGHYNYPVNYAIKSNVLIHLVDRKQGILGNHLEEAEEGAVEALKKGRPNVRKKIFKKIQLKTREMFNPYFSFQIGKKKEFYFFDMEMKVGEKAEIHLPKKVVVKNKKEQTKKPKTYKLIGAYLLTKRNQKMYLEEVKSKKNEELMRYEIVLGLEDQEVYGEYEREKSIKKMEEDIIEKEGEPNPFGEIGSGIDGQSEFKIEEGIPVTESYYKRVKTEKYLLNYVFKKVIGEEKYSARSRIVWNLSWEEKKKVGKKVKKITKSKKVSKIYTTPIKRRYSYWIVDKLEYYVLDGAFVKNNALPDSSIKITPKGYSFPDLTVKHSLLKEDHLIKPKELNHIIELGEKTALGKDPPSYNPKQEVDLLVEPLKVKNDFLSLEGSVIMGDEERVEVGKKPLIPESIGPICDDKTLYDVGKKIEISTQNGWYPSNGSVRYRLQKGINGENKTFIEYEIPNINAIRVHTPVACDYVMQDAKEWCQLLEPNDLAHQLVLTKPFFLSIHATGRHLPLSGYGTRDYEKYVKEKHVIFPFDVLVNGKIHQAGIPLPVIGKTVFSLPSYVKEGEYTIELRSYALNSFGKKDQIEEYVNLDEDNYVASNRILVQVSGRLFDFTLEEVKHSSLWKGALEKIGSQNGVKLSKLPLINGNHPEYQNLGDFKKGYALRFSCITIGDYLKEPYGVGIEFSFYVYDSDYKRRIPVDVYYEAIREEDHSKIGFVKIGSKKDRENLHFVEIGRTKVPIFTYKKALMPNLLSDSSSTKSVQKWWGEYSLPARLYVCRKGYDISSVMKKTMALHLEEEFWIKKGKLVVCADIYTLKGSKKSLSYRNEKNERKGYRNNWKEETSLRVKYNEKGERIYFQEGEVFVFDLEKSIWLERAVEIRNTK